jgi:predicted N-acetyltransferase YhbS
MELRTCTPLDREKAIGLAKAVFKANMGDQFLCLFGEENLKNMFVAVEKDNVVSMVNYYPADVLVQEGVVKTGSVGAVCTKSDFRGQKIASRLLEKAEKQMISEGISLMIISGQGGIYSAIEAEFAGSATECFVPKGNFPKSPEIALQKYRVGDFPVLKELYERELVRFVRKEEEFKKLLKGQTFPDTFATYPMELILHNGTVAAYVILHLETDPNSDLLGFKEYGGNRKALIAAFDNLLEKYGKAKVHFATDPHDELERYLEGCEKKPIHQFASLKVINYPLLMEGLKPYWERLFPSSKGIIGYYEENGTYILTCGTEKLTILNVVLLTRMIFGFNEPVEIDFSGCPNLEKFVKRIFPIPFAWTHNINYQ